MSDIAMQIQNLVEETSSRTGANVKFREIFPPEARGDRFFSSFEYDGAEDFGAVGISTPCYAQYVRSVRTY